MPAANPDPKRSAAEMPRTTVRRILRAERHLTGLERHLRELGMLAEAAAARTARDYLAGRLP